MENKKEFTKTQKRAKELREQNRNADLLKLGVQAKYLYHLKMHFKDLTNSVNFGLIDEYDRIFAKFQKTICRYYGECGILKQQEEK